MNQNTVKEIKKIHDKCIALGVAKSHDYSSTIDNIRATGIAGIAVRLVDKACRVHSLTHTLYEDQCVKTESLEDTLMDMINYASYGICLLRGKWNEES